MTVNVASFWMSEYSIALSPRNASAAMIAMGMNGNTQSLITSTSFRFEIAEDHDCGIPFSDRSFWAEWLDWNKV
jgi:hypothetical protein